MAAKDCASHCQPETDRVQTILTSLRERLFSGRKDRSKKGGRFMNPKTGQKMWRPNVRRHLSWPRFLSRKRPWFFLRFPENKASYFKGHATLQIVGLFIHDQRRYSTCAECTRPSKPESKRERSQAVRRASTHASKHLASAPESHMIRPAGRRARTHARTKSRTRARTHACRHARTW